MDVMQSFHDLNDSMAVYVQHPIRQLFVTMLPFRLGYWLGSFFIDAISNEAIAAKKRDMYVDKMIAQARESIKNGDEKNDLATILVKMGDKDGGEILSTQQLRSHLYTFMFAGFDTSASVIHWILFYVGQFPDIVKRIGKVQNDTQLSGLVNELIRPLRPDLDLRPGTFLANFRGIKLIR